MVLFTSVVFVYHSKTCLKTKEIKHVLTSFENNLSLILTSAHECILWVVVE